MTEPDQPAVPTGYYWTVTIGGSPTAPISKDKTESVTVTNKLNANSGALTIGFSARTRTARESSRGLLRNVDDEHYETGELPPPYAPFQDLSATASCANANGSAKPDLDDVQSYVYDVIKLATCTTNSKTCSMLKAQMLATSLNVYFSDPALGGTQIGAYNGLGLNQQPIGAMVVDLSSICKTIDGSGGSATCSSAYTIHAGPIRPRRAGGSPSSRDRTSETSLSVSTILTRVAATPTLAETPGTSRRRRAR